MVVCTNIYAPNERTELMLESFARHGYYVHVNTCQFDHGRTFNNLMVTYRDKAKTHDTFVYSDAGDTFCQRPFTVPNDRLIWSTEKQCYPEPQRATEYPETDSEFKYLNNGGYGGSLELMVEFGERYIGKLRLTANCQKETVIAFLKAKKDGFPIYLDYGCEIFQTLAGTTKEDFDIFDGLVVNKMTKTTPAILHGNGTTPMKWVYQL